MSMDAYPTYFEKDNITSGYSPTKMNMFNTFKPRQNGRRLKTPFLKFISLNEFVCHILKQISLKLFKGVWFKIIQSWFR